MKKYCLHRSCEALIRQDDRYYLSVYSEQSQKSAHQERLIELTPRQAFEWLKQRGQLDPHVVSGENEQGVVSSEEIVRRHFPFHADELLDPLSDGGKWRRFIG